MTYGSVEIPAPRPGRRSLRITGALLLGMCALAAVSVGLYSGSSPTELLMPKRFQGKGMVQTAGFDGRPVAVPPNNKLDLSQGTLSSYQGEFSRSTKGSATQSLAAAPKHGLSAKAANKNIDAYFARGQRMASRPQKAMKMPKQEAAPRGKAPAHGLSTKAADSELDRYFAQQQKVAAEKRHPAKAPRQEAAPKGKAPAFGLSAAAALKDVEGYFAKEMRLAEATMQQKNMQKKVLAPKDKPEAKPQAEDQRDAAKEEEHKEEQGREEARKEEEEKEEAKHAAEEAEEHKEAEEREEKEREEDEERESKEETEEEERHSEEEGEEAADEEHEEEEGEGHKPFNPDELDHSKREVDHIGEIPVDKTLDAPLWSRGDSTLPDRMVPADKADCGEDMDCQSSRSPLLYKAKKVQKLSAYGRGAEDDNALELGKAVGVDNGQEEQTITTNDPPTEDMIDEVNGAIAEQRGDRYTDGNSMPAKKIKLPKAEE